MARVIRSRDADGSTVALYRPPFAIAWLGRLARYLGIIAGYPEPDDD